MAQPPIRATGVSQRPENLAGTVATAPVRAQPIAAWELHAHELAAMRAVLERAETDFHRLADSGLVLGPAERHQLRRRTALEGPCHRLALVVDDRNIEPGVRVDEVELLDGAG